MAQDVKERRGYAALLWRYRGPLALLVLVLLAVLLGRAWSRQRELTRQMELQEELIAALQKEEPEAMFVPGKYASDNAIGVAILAARACAE